MENRVNVVEKLIAVSNLITLILKFVRFDYTIVKIVDISKSRLFMKRWNVTLRTVVLPSWHL